MTPGAIAVELARELVTHDTTSHRGAEEVCARLLGDRLNDAGFAVTYSSYGDGHTSLVAYLGNGDNPALCLTGHLDTVPCGATPWKIDPFSGAIMDGRLHGRGACDMKSGVAAIVTAAMTQADRLRNSPGALLVLTAGEEIGCQGARHLVQNSIHMRRAGAVVVAEPTNNRVLLGHKGALWLRLALRGKSAHGSMPEHGDSALLKGAYLATHLADFRLPGRTHPHLGNPSLNIGTFHSGTQINMVPDLAEMTIDIRTTPNFPHASVIARLREHLNDHAAEFDTLLDLPSIWTDAEHPWVRSVLACVERHLGASALAGGASYFTDGCVLGPAAGDVPVIILGPGDPAMAHQTDEYCEVAQIHQSVEMMTEILQDWCQRPSVESPAPVPGFRLSSPL